MRRGALPTAKWLLMRQQTLTGRRTRLFEWADRGATAPTGPPVLGIQGLGQAAGTGTSTFVPPGVCTRN